MKSSFTLFLTLVGEDYLATNTVQGETIGNLNIPAVLEYRVKTSGRYKSLADIERGFRVLKSDFEIGPV